MENYSIANFVRENSQQPDTEERFQLENDFLLKVSLNGQQVWTKMGSMVAYNGRVHLAREGLLRQGFRLFKKSVSKQDIELTKASGVGELFVADQGKKVTLLKLEGETLFVHHTHLLAFESSIKWDIHMTKSLTAAMVSGLFHAKLEGNGMVAITTRLRPLVLKVSEGNPIHTDPQNTVAWSGNLQPEMTFDTSLGMIIGRTSGDTIQMKFQGEGFVVVQSFEEFNMHK